jgi:hypothetical protein
MTGPRRIDDFLEDERFDPCPWRGGKLVTQLLDELGLQLRIQRTGRSVNNVTGHCRDH